MDHAKLLDVLTSLLVSRSILPRVVCFATSRPANHAICSFIDSSGYASGPIRRCLFIDYIIKDFIMGLRCLMFAVAPGLISVLNIKLMLPISTEGRNKCYTSKTYSCLLLGHSLNQYCSPSFHLF